MRLLILIATMWAIAYAKPEMYRESEDFQYSRSSSDEGKKSGFYGSQRGNMGGNYERAHNMDGLAQHQMSTAVRQVEGELGEGAKAKSGSVFTAANSRGIFGSGHYDLSLQGRNFDESSDSDILSHSSLTSQNTGYRSSAHNSGYNRGYTKSSRQSTGFASADLSEDHSTDFTQSKFVDGAQQAINQHSYGNQEALGSDYKIYSHAGNRAQNQMVGTNLHSTYDAYGRRITDTPVRVIMRPGTSVTVPVSAQTYDASSSSLRGASYGQNSLNTEAEELSNSDSSVYVKPNTIYYTKPKHYESSYNYRKEWEKHSAYPEGNIPTENPLTKNSELYDDSLLLQNAKGQYNAIDSSSTHGGSDVVRSRNTNIGHLKSVNAAQQTNSYNTKSSSRHQSQYNYETASNQNAAASAHSNSYTVVTPSTGAAVNAYDLVENIDSKPKTYHSSYAYHKSWERRGDPYVIKPIGGDNSAQISQKLVSGSANQGMYSSHQYGSHYNQAHQSLTKGGVDCDENGHIRVARSSQGQPWQKDEQQFEDLGQEIQNQWGGLEDLGQQTQNKWDNLQGQLIQQSQKLEDFGQQHQNLEDLGQQNLENFSQQHQNLEDLGQQNLESFNPQHQNLEDLGQQNLENFNQQHQNLEDLGQQLHNQWDKFDQFNKQSSSIISEETPELESFEKPKVNKESIGPLSDFNQHQESDKQNANTFWNQHKNFDAGDVSQNTDQLEGFTNEDFQMRDSQQLQNQLELQKKLIGTMYDILSKHKKNDDFQPSISYSNPSNYHHNINYNDGENQYTGFSHYSHEASNNGMSSTWQKQYNIQGSHNNNKPTAPLQNFWSKLDNLDTQGMINTNKGTKDENSYSQMSDMDWSNSNWGQFHAHHDNHMFDGSFTHDEKNSIMSQTLKATTSVNSVLSKEIGSTTSKPTYNPISNMPISPVDVGRGDIGADETTELNNENERTNVYIPNSPHKHYKTTDEIESLSLTEENNNSAKVSHVNSQQTSEDKWNQLFKHHDVIEHKVEDYSSTQTSATTKAIKYKPTEKYSNTYTGKDAIASIEKINKQKDTTSDIVEDMAHKIEQFPYHNEQKISNQQDILNSYNFEEQSHEPAKESEIQQNVNEQFEEFGQPIQNTYDIGQSSQSFWEPANSEQSEVQQLENFGSFESIENQQLETLERSNDKLQSQSLLNFEQHTSWEPVIDNQPNNQQQKPMSTTIKTFSQELNEKQGDPPSLPHVITSEETATEKAGFWKSFGSKFTGAKDTVVSWFKGS
ncbi:uncharacterized protein LOC110993149 isoform X2 [Pieris rapae]|uniref:uncharacterized protein LOC110993149 isoform X2 n=1 Tax=Pieris rapae TaxID=64459 RepID=UPI001E28142E|nr:uncharacterized protein LOC110993149 isoform X2 [Pieris rapae]